MLNKVYNMNWLLYAIICLLWFSACTKEQCRYEDPISDIYILNWNSLPIPKSGVAYIYKRDTHFTELIDTVRFYAIARGIADSTDLDCILSSNKLNYLNDIRVVLDDTLACDISNITLSWFVDNRHWTMGGPMEYCIVSSLAANGNITRDTAYSGSLAFPQKHMRNLNSSSARVHKR